MPGYDGTGPFGDGRPGRGLGPCGRFEGVALRRGFGRGYGRGFGGGFGRGFGRGYGYRFRAGAYNAPYNYPEPVYVYSKEDLQAQKADLEKQLQWLNEQLAKEDKN